MNRARVKHSPVLENTGWCETCDWTYLGPLVNYGPSRAAQKHAERNGHKTVVERYRHVEFDSTPLDEVPA